MKKEKKYMQLQMKLSLYDKLKKEMGEYGFTSVSPFIRFIIYKFFKDNL